MRWKAFQERGVVTWSGNILNMNNKIFVANVSNQVDNIVLANQLWCWNFILFDTKVTSCTFLVHMKLSWANTAFTSLVETILIICTRTVVTSSQTSLIASCLLSQARISLLQHFWHQCLAGFAQKCSNLSWREVTAMWVVKWPFVCVNLQRFLYCFDEGSCDGRQLKHMRSVNCNFWELWSVYREHEDFQILDSNEGQCKSHKFVKIQYLTLYPSNQHQSTPINCYD